MRTKNFAGFLAVIMMLAAMPVSAEPVALIQEASMAAAGSRAERAQKKEISRFSLKRNPQHYGVASWYSENDPAINKHTANGEVFDDSKMTCASWEYPFGTRLEVKNLENGKSVICRVNDRGPSKRLERLIDLSKGSFRKIASTRRGLIRVSVRVVPPSHKVKA